MQYEVRNFMLHEIGGTISSVLVRRQLEGVGATLTGDYFKGLERLSKALPRRLAGKMIVYGGEEEYVREGVSVTNPRGLAGTLTRIAAALGSI
jgi:hypothetical protein